MTHESQSLYNPLDHANVKDDAMFLLKKSVSAFILPPGIFVAAIMLVAGLMIVRRRWTLGVVNLTLALTLWALSTFPVANFLIQGLEMDFSIPADPSGDVIVLLGGGVIDRVPDLTGTATLSPLMMGRVVTAARLYQRLKLPIIVTGGRGFHADAVSEAAVVKRFLVDLGVPANRIIEEDRARDTAENAGFTALVCRQSGFFRPILLTSAYHLKRARMAFDAAGLTVIPFPAYFLGSRGMPSTWIDWLPRISNFRTASIALHEYVGLIYYQLPLRSKNR